MIFSSYLAFNPIYYCLLIVFVCFLHLGFDLLGYGSFHLSSNLENFAFISDTLSPLPLETQVPSMEGCLKFTTAIDSF
jgi:hypothetical protein